MNAASGPWSASPKRNSTPPTKKSRINQPPAATNQRIADTCAEWYEKGTEFKNEGTMKKGTNQKTDDDLRPEYDLAKMKDGVRGKYAKSFRVGTNLILLSPDVAPYFPDEASVNAALRSLVGVAKAQLHPAH